MCTRLIHTFSILIFCLQIGISQNPYTIEINIDNTINTYDKELSLCYYYHNLDDERFNIDLIRQATIITNIFADRLIMPFRITKVYLHEIDAPFNVLHNIECEAKINQIFIDLGLENIKDNFDINILVGESIADYTTGHYLQGIEMTYLNYNDIGLFRPLLHEIIHEYYYEFLEEEFKHVNEDQPDLFTNWRGEIQNNIMAQPNMEVFNFFSTAQQFFHIYEEPIYFQDSYHSLPRDIVNDHSIYTNSEYASFQSEYLAIAENLVFEYGSICSISDSTAFLAKVKSIENNLNINESAIMKVFEQEAEYIVKGTDLKSSTYAQMKMQRLKSKIYTFQKIRDVYYSYVNRPNIKKMIQDKNKIRGLWQDYSKTNPISFSNFNAGLNLISK